jgi:hypothetical protein
MSTPQPTQTPNVVIEDPRVRKAIRTVVDAIGGITFIAGAVDLASADLDFASVTIPVMAAYTAARVVFGFAVDNTNTPK